jgi:hypothetical protein
VRWRTLSAKRTAAFGSKIWLQHGKKLNGIQPRYAPPVGNISLYVCQRTVRPELNGYKGVVDGWSQFRLFLSWPE